MTGRFPLRRIAGAVAALAVAASLAACSSSGSGGSAASGDDALGLVKPGALTVCTGDSPPNIFYDENNELTGVEIDMANAFADNLGLKTELAEYAFAGLIPALQANQCDVIMGSLYIKPEREEIANFVPYLYSGTGVGVSKENPKGVTGVDDSLCGLKVVAITGATGGNGAEELSAKCEADGEKALNLTLVDEGTAAVQQVITGQQDAFIDTSEIMDFYNRESDGALVMAGEPVGKIKIGAATLKDNTALNEALDGAMQQIIDDGDYAALLEKWGVQSADITAGE
ncbi:ABC transporter substrate-binding protein [Agromyces sp. H3Y2-19a]|jgi:polar amino acid transport system substrate-binding protein|uniref:ABC transporter substrate-binding protein n=1 Tax=Agromyces TaxID=33877 RepID=UPI001E493ADA|nr:MULTISPECIES: ABC transporter substrate-binding protein [Agromyces]MCD5345579.1 ABC transporter substrate-binding protein [Agromyces sp. S2-1-8]MDF0515513.1 ABC transporter substrate-binding protein [Agromyces chromiiresistens]